MKTKDFSDLKDRLKYQVRFILGILLANLVVIYLLKIDTQIFNIVNDLMTAVVVNIISLFIKKK